MGVVFRATQLALQRPVALKAIAPQFAADTDYRERFQRESHLAASIDHPNVIPVYEAGEVDGTLYLIMRWIDGTDLRALLTTSGRLSPRRAISLLRPVASALAAAHRHGLVHRDVKPANVLIARGDEEYDDHIYLTDFGIARRSDGESLTGTGVFVGTVDYMAPERIEGGKGEAPCDIYSFGCMLFEAVTGHVPFDRPSEVSKIFAHVNDPIPSAREEVHAVPAELDAIIQKSMAKRPEDRFGSAGELTAALRRALRDLEKRDRTMVAPPPTVVPEPIEPTVLAEPTEPTAVAEPIDPTAIAEPTEPTAIVEPSEPTAIVEPSEPTAVAEPRRVTPAPAAAGPPPRRPPTDRPSAEPKRRRSLILWAAAVLALVVAGVVAVVLTSSGGSENATSVKIDGAGLSEGQALSASSTPNGVAVGTRHLFVSLASRNELLRSTLGSGSEQITSAAGGPTALAASTAALWVAQSASQSLAQFNGDTGAQVHAVKLAGIPAAVAADRQDSSAWVADSSGAIVHVAVGGKVIGTPARSDPAAVSLAWGEGWLWAVNGADDGLVRVSLNATGSTKAFSTGPRPVAVALDQGVWTAHANGHLTRFNPQPGQLRVNADISVSAAGLDGVAATDPSPFVWAISRSARTLYRVTNASQPAVTGTVVFGSPPVALAVAANSVWVATQNGRVVEIRF
jgi:serine/threonine-protein kinase